MNAEDLARKAKRDVPWDDLREQRVLSRVLAERTQPAPRRRYAAGAMAVAAMVAVAAIVFFVVRARTMAAPIATAPAEQTMALADGSQAVLLREAGVQIEEQSSDRVRIAQSRGAVRYEVRPDPSREFTVRAAGATIRVRGTVFVVDIKGDSVEVRVDRGRVEVDDGMRTRDIVAGEVLRVPARAEPAPSAPPDTDIAPSASARTQPSAAPIAPTAAELQSKADAARLSGNLGEAATTLETLIARYPRDGRVPSALFSLGRVERARGRHAASAQAFERCARGGGALAPDALAEAAASWTAAGATDAARADAAQYLARYPNGPQAARMKAIAGP